MSIIRSSDEIYGVVENALQNISEPQTCAALMDRPEVRAAAMARYGDDVQIATNKLSDLLAFMWRRGVLDRFPAPPSRSMARYAYALTKQFADAETPIPYVKESLPKLGKHALSIVERDGEVILDFQQFTIVVKPK
jgi:hypothetical protein